MISGHFKYSIFCFAFIGLGAGLWPTGMANATPLTTGADFLLMTTGARPDGMGQAFSAVADDINTLSFNPAGLGNIRMPEVGYGYESFVAGINYNFVGAGIPMGGAGVLGLGYISMGTAPFNSTANPSIPTSSAQDQALVGGWGRSFYDLHVGAAVKYIARQLDTVHGNGLGFDLGLRYRLQPTLTLAASAMNIGEGIRLASLEPLPTLINTGIAWTALEIPFHSLTLAANGAFDVATNNQQLGFGAEYWYRELFALRAGYLAHSIDTSFNSDGFSAGAGIRISFMQLDYAFQPFNTLGMVHRVSGILRWDGPWVAGGEPNPPKYVNARLIPKAIEICWEKPQGPVQSYEVLVQPLDGSRPIVSQPVVNPIYDFPDYKPGTLYRISVRSINHGIRSFPSDETYLETEGVQVAEQKPIEPEAITAVQPTVTPTVEVITGKAAPPLSAFQGLEVEADVVGLRISWKEPAGAIAGYNLYRKSPSNHIEKVTQEPKKSNTVWVTDTSGLQGWVWIVTAVAQDGLGEKVVGKCLWYPSPQDAEILGKSPAIKLNASPQPGWKVYLDWDSYPSAAGYALLVSREPDNVYEFFEETQNNQPNALLQVRENHNPYCFIVVPKSANGSWLKRSNEAKVELFTDVPKK